MIFHDRNINNEQTQNCNQNDTVCKLIVDIIPYRMSTFVLINILRFLSLFRLHCIKFRVTVKFLVLDVKQPKIYLFDVIDEKILVFNVFEAPLSRPS